MSWARESPSEFSILEDLVVFDVDFFENHRDVTHSSKRQERYDDSDEYEELVKKVETPQRAHKVTEEVKVDRQPSDEVN